MKNKWLLRVAIIFNFVLPALLLNCVGIVILRLINVEGVSMPTASWLEAYKDFSILIGSFLLATYIPRMGYRKSMLVGVLLESVGCLLMGLFSSIWSARLFFVCVGVGFALIKVSVYASVGLLTNNEDEHASYLSFFEGLFMIGVLSGYWIFGYFIGQGEWSLIFFILAGFALLGLFLLFVVQMDESRLGNEPIPSSMWKEYGKMFVLLRERVVWLFVILAFFYIFLEQGIMDWLPTFDNHILKIVSSSSVELASLLSGGLALGRLFFGFVMRYLHWRRVLLFCIISGLVVLIVSVYMAANIPPPHRLLVRWQAFPAVAFILPSIGFFLGPVYPTLCSTILSHHSLRSHSALTVWIVIFSALGGTMGSRILGGLFSIFGGLRAFGILFLPLIVLMLLILPYAYSLRWSKK